jgi:hypothetical protein
MSLVVVATALPFRTTTVGVSEIASHWPVIINIRRERSSSIIDNPASYEVNASAGDEGAGFVQLD